MHILVDRLIVVRGNVVECIVTADVWQRVCIPHDGVEYLRRKSLAFLRWWLIILSADRRATYGRESSVAAMMFGFLFFWWWLLRVIGEAVARGRLGAAGRCASKWSATEKTSGTERRLLSEP
jgi:hypothetical protein